MKEPAREARGERALLSAVVALAINDACNAPKKSDAGLSVHPDAKSALRFLFGLDSGLENYAAWLDFDHQRFRRRLHETMFRDGDERRIKETDKRSFRFNFNKIIGHYE